MGNALDDFMNELEDINAKKTASKNTFSAAATKASVGTGKKQNAASLDSFVAELEAINAKKAVNNRQTLSAAAPVGAVYNGALKNNSISHGYLSAKAENTVDAYETAAKDALANVNPEAQEYLTAYAEADNILGPMASAGADLENGLYDDMIYEAQIKKQAAVDNLKKLGYSDDDIEILNKYNIRAFNAEANEKLQAQTEKEYNDASLVGKVAMNVGSVMLNIGGGMSAAYQNVKDAIDGSPTIDTNSPYYGMQNISDTIREKTVDSINSKLGKYIYQLGMSSVDSIVASIMPGWTGEIMLGLSAGASKSKELTEKNVDARRTNIESLASAVFEGLFEHVTISNLKAFNELTATNVKGILLNMVKSSVSNASEEGATELANILFDTYFMGDMSDYAEKFRTYTQNGLTEKQAKTQVLLDFAAQIGMSSLGGFLQGLMFGGIGSISSFRNYSKMDSVSQAVFDTLNSSGISKTDTLIGQNGKMSYEDATVLDAIVADDMEKVGVDRETALYITMKLQGIDLGDGYGLSEKGLYRLSSELEAKGATVASDFINNSLKNLPLGEFANITLKENEQQHARLELENALIAEENKTDIDKYNAFKLQILDKFDMADADNIEYAVSILQMNADSFPNSVKGMILDYQSSVISLRREIENETNPAMREMLYQQMQEEQKALVENVQNYTPSDADKKVVTTGEYQNAIAPKTDNSINEAIVNIKKSEAEAKANAEYKKVFNRYAELFAKSNKDGFQSLTSDEKGEMARLYSQLNGAAYTKKSKEYGTEDNYIENRTLEYVGKRGTKAFQFDYPELHDYFAAAANQLIADLGDSLKASSSGFTDRFEYVFTGNKRFTSKDIAELLDDVHLSYAQIDKACRDIIDNNGQENYAAAKKVELKLDEMMTEGYIDILGYEVPPDQDYINAKRNLYTLTQEELKAAQTADKQAQTAQDSVATEETAAVDNLSVKGDNTAETVVGITTKIKNPYAGITPQETDTVNTNRVVVPIEQKSVESANSVIENALGEENFKGSVKKALEAVFGDRFNNIKVDVKGLDFNGKPYAVTLNKNLIGKVVSDPNMSAEKIAVLNNLENVISESDYVGSGEYDSSKTNENVERYDYFETIVTIPTIDDKGEYTSERYVVTFDVEAYNYQNKFRTYKIKDIDLVPISEVRTGTEPAAFGGVLTGPLPAAPEIEPSLYDNSISTQSENVNNSNNSQTNYDTQQTDADDELDRQITGSLNAKASLTQSARMAAMSAQAPIEDIAKASGNKKLDVLTDAVRRAPQSSESMISGGAQYNYAGEKVGETLNKIKSDIEANGDDYAAAVVRYVRMRHNIDTSNNGKPILDMTPAECQAAIAGLRNKYSGIEQDANKITSFLKNLLQYKVDTQLVSADFADFLTELYGGYVPSTRDYETDLMQGPELDVSGWTKERRSQYISDGIKELQGNTKLDFLDLFTAIGRQTRATVRAGNTNMLAIEMAKTYRSDRAATAAEIKAINSEGQFTAEQSVYFYENGKRKQMVISKNMATAFKDLAGQTILRQHHELDNNFVTNAIKKANKVFKELTTGKNPVFLPRNFFKDGGDAVIYTKNAKNYGRSLLKAAREIANNSERWNLYQDSGAAASSYFNYNEGIQNKNTYIDDTGRTQTRGIRVKMERTNYYVEQLWRYAEYIATMENPDNSNMSEIDRRQLAMYNAAEITTNFSRHGTGSKFLNDTIVPFFNPGMQGASKIVRTFSDTKTAGQWALLVAKLMLSGFLPSFINTLLVGDEPDYDQISDYTKDTCYLIKVPGTDDKWIKIPKGRFASVWGMPGVRFAEALMGKENDGFAEEFKTMAKTAVEQTAPNNPFTNNIFSAVIDTSRNKTWYGGQIETTADQNLKASERYDSNTSYLSIYVAKALAKLGIEVSPKRMDYVIDQYSGYIGDFFMPMITQATMGKNVGETALNALVAPFKSSFSVDSTMQNNYYSRFDKIYTQVTQDTNSENPSEGIELVKKFLSEQNTAVYGLRREIKAIREDKTLSLAEKNEQIKIVQGTINAIYDNALKNYKAVSAAAASYYQGDDAVRYAAGTYNAATGYYAEDVSYSVKEQYAEMNKDLFGAQYALQSYSDDVYAMAQQANAAGISYDDFYAYYFETKTMNAKNANGQSITGLKKQRVANYINSLNMSRGQKLYLYAQNYDLTSSADIKALVDYINGMNISNSEKIELLSQFDFLKISDNGHVTW